MEELWTKRIWAVSKLRLQVPFIQSAVRIEHQRPFTIHYPVVIVSVVYLREYPRGISKQYDLLSSVDTNFD